MNVVVSVRTEVFRQECRNLIKSGWVPYGDITFFNENGEVYLVSQFYKYEVCEDEDHRAFDGISPELLYGLDLNEGQS